MLVSTVNGEWQPTSLSRAIFMTSSWECSREEGGYRAFLPDGNVCGLRDDSRKTGLP